MTRIGFIGLGSQGAPMARRIVEEGFPLTIWARRPESLEPFRATDAVARGTPRELAASSDVVAVCVVADADVNDVVLRPDGILAGMAPGGIIVIHSTVHPDTCRAIAQQAERHDVTVVDAPVSGGGDMAADRKLSVMVGGAAEDVARCRPMFECYASSVLHLGPLGSAETAKLLNNLVFIAQLGLAIETFDFARQLGIDRAALAAVLVNSSGGSRAAAILAQTDFDTSGPRGALPVLRKDVDLVLGLAREADVDEPRSLSDLVTHTFTALGAAPPASQVED
jgi:3-hydroxyisobutyrate dehydrogenase